MMGAGTTTAEDLEGALRAVDPRVRFVSARLLRQIVKRQSKLGVLGLHVAHRRSLTIPTEAALRSVDADDLKLDPRTKPPAMLLLIEAPEIDGLDADRALVEGWRRLFHARVHAEFASSVASGRLDCEAVRSRIERVGRVEFAEIRGVLEDDDWLMTPEDAASVYEEFAAVYLELRQFAERLLPSTFPGIEDFARVDALLASDLDGGAIFEATRPEGAPDPRPHPAIPDSSDRPREVPSNVRFVRRSESRSRRLIKRADRARGLGNAVRSAILRKRAARLVGPSRAGQARSGAEDDLDGLADRLVAALGIDRRERPRWRPALSALLDRTESAVWTVEARLLYDLQKVCVDHEREIYEVNLLGWALSLGRRPLKKPLPNQRLVRTAKHLRTACSRLPKVRVGEEDRHDLSEMIRDATEAAERALRDRFRPLIERALDRAELKPRDLPERVSFAKMTEELLDRVVESSYLTMGDVRDAVSRGALRQPDLSGPRELARGDRILLANRRLGISLEGVYHRGEVYLRMLQRASFLAFGTKLGRWLTRYVALPYGAAFGALVTVQEVLGLAGLHFEMVHGWTVLTLGTLALMLLHWPTFRRGFLSAIATSWRGVQFLFHEIPAWLLDRPWVRLLLASPLFDIVRRVVLQPLICSALAYGIVAALEADRRVAAGIAAVVYATLTLFLVTPLGLKAEEYVADATVRAWGRFRADFLPGLIRLVLDVFDRFLEAVERVLYAVDERLRFRSGQGPLTLAAKAVLGLFWAFLTYLIRIYINLLVEPQINPVKHFPTVTVAAKMILPYLKVFAHHIAAAVWFLGKVPANAVAWTTVFFLPGLAGFVVWELKENWRLFEANRPRTLRPATIGHHGESMRRLIRPGFHSGTVPKLFAKLRRAERKSFRTGDSRAASKALGSLHEVREAIGHFAERELLELLERCGRFGDRGFKVGEIVMATNRITIHVGEAAAPSEDLRLRFEDDDGRLSARVERSGWRDSLSPSERRTLDAALLGLFAFAGAEEVQAMSRQGPSTDPPSAGENRDGESDEDASGLFADSGISWRSWVAFWEAVPTTEVDRSPTFAAPATESPT